MTPAQRGALDCLVQATRQHLRLALDRRPMAQAARHRHLNPLLNGMPGAAVARILGRGRRRADGIYFSGPDWSRLVAQANPLAGYSRLIDPSSGIGDLLLHAARRLPLQGSLQDTLTEWSSRLVAWDLHPAFVAMAWHRIAALAAHRLGVSATEGPVCMARPPSFMAKDALASPWRLREGDALLMNPPFQAIRAPADCTVAAGRVTAAVPFIERAIRQAPAGVLLVALVPEVLRSGSRFARLRGLLEARCENLRFEAQGRFSVEADIDVALLVARTRAPATRASATPVLALQPTKTMADLASVRVGAVVPHRTEESGPARPYIAVADVPAWATVTPTAMRRFTGPAFQPPFVVVRRTSGPRDRERVRATLITGSRPVTVENHLMILQPKRPSVRACRRLMAALKRPQVHTWLNSRIRCRHLTVDAVREIPVD